LTLEMHLIQSKKTPYENRHNTNQASCKA